jgi:hypothetical protein
MLFGNHKIFALYAQQENVGEGDAMATVVFNSYCIDSRGIKNVKFYK